MQILEARVMVSPGITLTLLEESVSRGEHAPENSKVEGAVAVLVGHENLPEISRKPWADLLD